MSDTLTDTITPFFEGEDIDNFKDKSYKKSFLDKIEKKTGKNRKSLDIKFNEILKSKLDKAGKNSEDFVKPRTKKFSKNLDVTSKVNDVDIKEGDKFPSTQNPKGKLLPAERKELPMGAVAGSLNSFIGAFFEDYPELSSNDREDIGTCLEMAFGDYIQTHENMRKVTGGIGVLGIIGGQIRKAKSNKKTRLKLEEKKNPTDKLPKITKSDKAEFDKQSQAFIENKIESDR